MCRYAATELLVKTINAIKDVLQGNSRPTWTGTIILVMVLMIAVMVAGFLFVSDRQKKLHDGRIENRDMRMARQALMETDVAVLNAMIDTVRGDARRYGVALDKLSAHPDSHFPVTVKVEGKVIPGPELIRSLKNIWADMMARISVGDSEGARKIYVERDVQSNMEGAVRAIIHDLERLDTSNDSMQQQAELATAAVMIMQLLSGLFCIVAFLFATRRGAVEATARAQAVVTANESREQVMRLFQMTDMLQSATDHSDAKAVLRSTALELMPDLTGALYLFNNSRDRLALAACWNLGDDEPPVDVIGLSECWALKRGKAHINHAQGDKLCCDHHKQGFHALEIPMAARGQVLGLLGYRRRGPTARNAWRKSSAWVRPWPMPCRWRSPISR